jgi:hypothetical protein
VTDPDKTLSDRFRAIRRLRPYYEDRGEGYIDVLPADLALDDLRAKIELAKRIWQRSQIEGNPPLQEELYLAINFAMLVLYRLEGSDKLR